MQCFACTIKVFNFLLFYSYMHVLKLESLLYGAMTNIQVVKFYSPMGILL